MNRLPILNTVTVRGPDGHLVHCTISDVLTLNPNGPYVITCSKSKPEPLPVIQDVKPDDFYQIHGQPYAQTDNATMEGLYARLKAQDQLPTHVYPRRRYK